MIQNQKTRQKSSLQKAKRQKDPNEINIIRRTLENNTHEVIEDTKIKKVTSWRKSQPKFFKSMIYNILSFGILHIVSLFHPNLFIKLYCNPSSGVECDYFLVENIYGKLTLCPNIYRKKKLKKSNLVEKEKENLELIDKKRPEYELTKHLTYSFIYKSNVYEYNEEKNEIIPVYMNLAKMTNKGILDFFLNGLSTLNSVNKFRERYGKNEYAFDIKLLFLFFLNNEIPSYAIVIAICAVQTVAFPDFTTLFGKIAVVIALILIQLINLKITIINKYKKELTLDGNETKIKVKRNYLLKNSENHFTEINPEEILPGDIIFLKANDFVPCDCIIMEGECIANESNLTGKLDIYKKTSLEDNNEFFDYRHSNINILYHGMKILKTFSKFNDNYISVLCINTGPNTFKANQYSNIFYFLERKKEYNYVYNLFGERKVIFYYILIAIAFTQIYGVALYEFYEDEIDVEKFKSLLKKIITGCISECLMQPYFLAHSFMILLGIFRLQGNGIICFDKSRLINSGRINTIVFNKTGTLSNDTLEISGYHIPNYEVHKKGKITYNIYNNSQSKEINVHLLNYYKEYLEIKENNNTKKKNSPTFLLFNKLNSKFESRLALFIECLLSCNNIDKYGIELFGNKIETNLFNEMKWDLKQISGSNTAMKSRRKSTDQITIKYNKSNNFSNYIIVQKKICDIFPKNYYRLGESTKNASNDKSKNISLDITQSSDNRPNDLLKSNKQISNLIDGNPIISDINKSHTNSYRLRIYKKFLNNGTLINSAIVYNFIKEELRFMTRGFPEDIINKCNRNSVPDDLVETISINRRNGFIVMVCASKLIDVEDYNDNDELDSYMDDLTFCGLITLKNKINDNVKFSIEQISEFKCKMVISSADNEYNCLSAGFNSGILENNNIFVFDLKNKTNKLSIKKIYSSKSIIETENKKENKDHDKVSRISKNISQFKRRADVKRIKIRENNNDLINEINISNNLKRSSSLINKNDRSNIEDYSEARKLAENSNYRISELNEYVYNYDKYKNQPRAKKDDTSINISVNNPNQNNQITKNFQFFENVTYHHRMFEEYQDLNEGIYCISSEAFNFMYKNRTYKGIQFLLQKINKNSKIFFNMSSTDKTRLIDYYRESGDNVVCSLGECDSDLDAIISSNVGLSLKNPPNQNMILCHFYSSKKDIIGLKSIITIGRLLYENSILLEIVSFSCSVSINFFLVGCLIKTLSINGVLKNQLTFLDLEFVILELFSFAGSPKEKTNMIKNKKLLNLYYIVQLIALLLFKISSIQLFSYLYKYERTLDIDEQNYEYISFLFILCVEFVINSIFIFNHISFYREPPFSNLILAISSLVIFIYVILLICFNSSNYNTDFIGLTKFAFSEYLMDTYSDQNRLWLTVTLCFDFSGSFLFCSILYIIFNWCSK